MRETKKQTKKKEQEALHSSKYIVKLSKTHLNVLVASFISVKLFFSKNYLEILSKYQLNI